jgi:hypothetical protein
VDEHELRRRLEDLGDDVSEVRAIVTQLQLASAEGRGDLKIVVGKLDNAATALANAAQSIQIGQLSGEDKEDGRLPKWARYAGLILLAIIAALIGVKEVVPTLLKLLSGTL